MTDKTGYLQSSLLSPFSMKARVLCQAFGLSPVYTPEDGNLLTAARLQARMELAPKGGGRCLHRDPSKLDEYPLVPWLFPAGGGYLCDSTEIGLYLERTVSIDGRLTPSDPATAFVARLIEEAVDEVGLYALHHMRWVDSARTNTAMQALADEIAGSLGRPAGRLFTRQFGPRQIRRLAYLFSVAPADDHRFDDLPTWQRPPSRKGFPPTHALLETVWEGMVDGVEAALADGRQYLFGNGLTLADAALIGNLGSTLKVDPDSAKRMRARAPKTVAWVERNIDGGATLAAAHSSWNEGLQHLVKWCANAFLPLMQANADAYAMRPIESGGPRNERAYNAGVGLFSGELLGHPYRTVVKDFQVKTYQELSALFAALDGQTQSQLARNGVGFNER